MTNRTRRMPSPEELAEMAFQQSEGDHYAIYQLKEKTGHDNYRFMRFSHLEQLGFQVSRDDYNLIYTGIYSQEDSLDALYERFNTAHPPDFTGHSLSVSDVVVLKQDGEFRAFYVDSVGYQELPDFLELYQEPERAYELPENEQGYRYFLIQPTEGGFDYTFLDEDYRDVDGGVYDNPNITMDRAVKDILDGEDLEVPDTLLNYEEISEKYEEVEQKAIQAIQDAQKRQEEREQQEKPENQEENTYDKNAPQNGLRIANGHWITFYVAECEEYHHLRDYAEYDSLEKAAVAYKKLRDDGRRHYYGNSLGIIYHDSTDDFYDGGEYPFIIGDTIHADNLDDVKHFAASPLVCKAVAQMREIFPDYEYIEPLSIRQSMYPKEMTASELADELDRVAREHHFYDREPLKYELGHRETILYDLCIGQKYEYRDWLAEIIGNGGEEGQRARILQERLRDFELKDLPEELMNHEPVVKILDSDAKELRRGTYLTFTDADLLVADLGRNLAGQTEAGRTGAEQGIFIKYKICLTLDEKLQDIDGRMEVGMEPGSLLENLRLWGHDEEWVSYLKVHDKDGYDSYMTKIQDLQERILPYLQQYSCLPEKMPLAAPETRKVTEPEKMPTSDRTVKDRTHAPADLPSGKETARKADKKASIHDRMKKNKGLLSGQKEKPPERNYPERS